MSKKQCNHTLATFAMFLLLPCMLVNLQTPTKLERGCWVINCTLFTLKEASRKFATVFVGLQNLFSLTWTSSHSLVMSNV